MMDCDKFKAFFSSYLDGGLLQDSRKDLQDHLQRCPACSETLYRVRIVRDSLRRLPNISVSEDFDFRLNREIAMLSRKKTPVWSGIFQNWKVPALGSAIVLAIVGFLLVVTLPDNETISHETRINTPQVAAPQLPATPQSQAIGAQQVSVPHVSRGALLDSTNRDSAHVSRDGIRLIGDH